MNLFVLHRDPRIAARWQCDRHVVKMTLEAAQILSSAAHLLGQRAPYRPTHLRHPCVVWTAACRGNWDWVVAHGEALAAEYRRRFGRVHQSARVIAWARRAGVGPPGAGRRRRFAQAVPEKYRDADPVRAYRRYYAGEKARFATWRPPSSPPPWWVSRRR